MASLVEAISDGLFPGRPGRPKLPEAVKLSHTVQVRMSDEMLDKVYHHARIRRMPGSELIREAVAAYFGGAKSTETP